MITKLLFFFALFLNVLISGYAQSRILKGVIKNDMGALVQGVEVSILGGDRCESTHDGQYSLDLSKGEGKKMTDGKNITLYINHKAYGHQTITFVLPQKLVIDITLKYEGLQRISGTVTDEETRSPIKDLEITFGREDTNLDSPHAPKTTTDEFGKFDFIIHKTLMNGQKYINFQFRDPTSCYSYKDTLLPISIPIKVYLKKNRDCETEDENECRKTMLWWKQVSNSWQYVHFNYYNANNDYRLLNDFEELVCEDIKTLHDYFENLEEFEYDLESLRAEENDYKKLSDLSGLKICKKLSKIIVNHNDLDADDFEKIKEILRKIDVLKCKNNNLENLSFLQGMQKLEVLDISFNFIRVYDGLLKTDSPIEDLTISENVPTNIKTKLSEKINTINYIPIKP